MSRERMPWEDILVKLDSLPEFARQAEEPVVWVLAACDFYAKKLAADRKRKDARTYSTRPNRAQYMREYRARKRAEKALKVAAGHYFTPRT